MFTEKRHTEKKRKIMSWLGLKISAVIIILCCLSLMSAFPIDNPTDDEHIEAFVKKTLDGWEKEYVNASDLQVARIDINFHKEPEFFVEAEGTVICPVGIDLYNSQEILAVESYPPFLRKLTTEGITNLSWEYAGAVNRDLRYVSLTLVKRHTIDAPEISTSPTYHSLPPDLREEALCTAIDLKEHGLHECVQFEDWVIKTAGDPPYTEQFLRIVHAIGANIVEKKDVNSPEDICAAIRDETYSVHRAHVLAVMAARQLKIPAFGFASASPKKIYLIGIYTDQAGWLLVDIENHQDGYFSKSPVLLTKTPIISPFEGSSHKFWNPKAAAYSKGGWSEVSGISWTEWLGRLSPDELPTDSTEAKTCLLMEK